MLALKKMPEQFKKWNTETGAPFSAPYFCFEPNNSTRVFEYPWAALATPIRPEYRILEIGGALSGFQFVLNSLGCHVDNVDPGRPAKGNVLACDRDTMGLLNKRLNTSVALHNTTLEKANLQPHSYDRVFSISVIEHIGENDIAAVMQGAYQCLKPGGLFIITIDLFLNIFPFTSKIQNVHGKNIDVRDLIEIAPFEIALGNTSELYGYPGFSSDKIQSHLELYVCGTLYPTLVQCVVLRKPG